MKLAEIAHQLNQVAGSHNLVKPEVADAAGRATAILLACHEATFDQVTGERHTGFSDIDRFIRCLNYAEREKGR